MKPVYKDKNKVLNRNVGEWGMGMYLFAFLVDKGLVNK